MADKKIECSAFFSLLREGGVEFFTGVPDSLLKNFCAYITENVESKNHLIAANEGNAIGIAAGYHLATGKTPLVYMQNSGLGNSVNPLLSLADSEVYSIPIVILIGWRGMPGVKDEPQHKKQGRVQNDLLEAMEIPCHKLCEDTDVVNIIRETQKRKSPSAITVPPGTFCSYKLKKEKECFYEMKREDALEIILSDLSGNEAIVSTTGKTSREVYEYRDRKGQGHEKDFLTVGSMGHTSQIALGIALNTSKKVICLDGDGSLIMHMGSMALNGSAAPENLLHVVINNGAHDSVGGQPTCGFGIDFVTVALACGYERAIRADNEKSLKKSLKILLSADEGPCLLEVRVKKGARPDLGRPATTPSENKKAFMDFLVDK